MQWLLALGRSERLNPTDETEPTSHPGYGALQQVRADQEAFEAAAAAAEALGAIDYMWVDGVGYVQYKATGGAAGADGMDDGLTPGKRGREEEDDEEEDEGEEERSGSGGEGSGSEGGEQESSFTALQLHKAEEETTASSRCWVRASYRLETAPGGCGWAACFCGVGPCFGDLLLVIERG